LPPPATPLLTTGRLILSPIGPDDALEMVGVLADPSLYAFTGGHPPNVHQLEARYRAQVAGSPSNDQVWHNWILRLSGEDVAVGFVQATVTAPQANVAWVIGTDWQGWGLASEAARAMCRWLLDSGLEELFAHIHPDHVASQHVAKAVGFTSTGEFDADGEVVWEMTQPLWSSVSR